MRRFGIRRSAMQGRLRNPYFQRTPAGARRRPFQGWRGIGVGAAIAVGAAAAIILPFEALTHPAFAVQDVEYRFEGVMTDREQAIRDAVDGVLARPTMVGLSRRDFFLLPTASVRDAVAATGAYDAVAVTRVFPHRMTVTVTQSVPVFLLADDAGIALGQGSGIVVDLLVPKPDGGAQALPPEIATSSLVAVHVDRAASSTDAFAVGQHGVQENCATLIKALDAGTRALGVAVTGYEVSDDQTTVTAHAKDGWDILTDPIVSATDQVSRLAAILRDPRMKDRKSISYVDVRYQDRVYVMPRSH